MICYQIACTQLLKFTMKIMKENISIESVNHLSRCLSESLIKTLDLSNESKVFAGNEEKLFILHILRKINNGELDSNKEVLSSYKHGELATFLGILSNEIKSRRNFIKMIYSLTQIKFLLHIKSVFNILFAPIIVSFDSAPYCKKNVTLNLSAYFLKFIRPSKKLRAKLQENLIEIGLNEDLAKIFSWHFPRSHLEGFKFLENSHLYAVKKIVYSNIYACQNDPIFSFLCKNNNTRLIYIQHGGGYALMKTELIIKLNIAGHQKCYFGVWRSKCFSNTFQA